MPLEPNVEHIDDLVDTNPAFDDPVNQGDDHDRITKTGMKGNVTGDDTNTRLLSNFEVVCLVGPNFCEISPTVAGGPDIRLDLADAGATKTHGGFRSDGTDLISIVNDALQGIVELRGSDAAPDDRKLASFDPTLGFALYRAGLAMLTGAASDLVVNGEDELNTTFTLESATGVEYIRVTGGPATNTIDVLVDGQALRLRGTSPTLQNLALLNPDTGCLFYVNGTGALGVVDGTTIGANIGAIQLNQVTTWSTGTGSPEGVVTASPGSIYSETTSGTAKPLWMKNFSAGNTGWLAIEFQP